MVRKTMSAKKEKQLLEIAVKHNGEMKERGDFEPRNFDKDDFLEGSIRCLKAMLEEALEAGRETSIKK